MKFIKELEFSQAELQKQQLRFYILVNGFLSIAAMAIPVYLVYLTLTWLFAQ